MSVKSVSNKRNTERGIAFEDFCAILKMENDIGYIIFVDDHRDEHELFRIAIAEVCSCKVLSAFDGQEALRLIDKHKSEIFAVVSDIRMPKLNGFELKRIIDSNPELRMLAMPFIFHSSAVDPIIVKEAYSLGIQGFIEKSDDLKKTVSILAHFIRFWSLTVHPSVFRGGGTVNDFSKKINL
jgi:CheY-like chemotaxis protein